MPVVTSKYAYNNLIISICTVVFLLVIGKRFSIFLSKKVDAYKNLTRKTKEEWHSR